VIYTHRGNIARMAAGTEKSRTSTMACFDRERRRSLSEYSAWPRPRQIFPSIEAEPTQLVETQ